MWLYKHSGVKDETAVKIKKCILEIRCNVLCRLNTWEVAREIDGAEANKCVLKPAFHTMCVSCSVDYEYFILMHIK